MTKFGILLAVLLPLGALAQGPQVAPPKAPFVVHAPPTACWSVTYQPRKALASQSVEACVLKQITVVKANGTRRTVSTWNNGTTTEQWIVPGFVLTEYPGQKEIQMLPENDSGAAQMLRSYSETDFPELNWLSIKNYARAEPYGGNYCWVFIEAGSSKKAWIESTTKLPAAVDDGTTLMVYTFLSPPAKPPQMPERFAKILDDYKAAMSALEKKYRMVP
jgi:hypothetical protein